MSLDEFSLLRLACDTHHITQLTPASLAMTNTPEDLNEPSSPADSRHCEAVNKKNFVVKTPGQNKLNTTVK